MYLNLFYLGKNIIQKCSLILTTYRQPACIKTLNEIGQYICITAVTFTYSGFTEGLGLWLLDSFKF